MDADAERRAEHISDEILTSDKDTDAMGVELRAYLDGLKNNKLVEAILPYVADDITRKELSRGHKLNYAVRAALSKAKDLKKGSVKAPLPIRSSAKLEDGVLEIKTHGEICWKLIWIIIILDIFRQE